MAPTMVGEAIKGGMLLRKVLSEAQLNVLSPCIVSTAQHEKGGQGSSPHTEPRDANGRIVVVGSLQGDLHLPGVATCMDSADTMHAMVRAVESSACMPSGLETPHSQLLVAKATSNADKGTTRSTKGGSAGGKAAGRFKVRTFTCVPIVILENTRYSRCTLESYSNDFFAKFIPRWYKVQVTGKQQHKQQQRFGVTDHVVTVSAFYTLRTFRLGCAVLISQFA